MAGRNIMKMDREYRNLLRKSWEGKTVLKGGSYDFTLAEVRQVNEIAGAGAVDSIVLSLNVGFMAGYKAAYKEMERKNKMKES